MMNQEIQNNGGNVKGVIVPLDVPGLTWANRWVLPNATDK
jgi:hypothetical protein